MLSLLSSTGTWWTGVRRHGGHSTRVFAGASEHCLRRGKGAPDVAARPVSLGLRDAAVATSPFGYPEAGRRSGGGLCWGATRQGIAGRKLTAMGWGQAEAGRLPASLTAAIFPCHHRGRFPHPSKTPACRVAVVAGVALPSAVAWRPLARTLSQIDLGDPISAEQDVEN